MVFGDVLLDLRHDLVFGLGRHDPAALAVDQERHPSLLRVDSRTMTRFAWREVAMTLGKPWWITLREFSCAESSSPGSTEREWTAICPGVRAASPSPI